MDDDEAVEDAISGLYREGYDLRPLLNHFDLGDCVRLADHLTFGLAVLRELARRAVDRSEPTAGSDKSHRCRRRDERARTYDAHN